MSGPPQVRRTDKLMPEGRMFRMLEAGFNGRLSTAGRDGYPYCVPLLYVWQGGELLVHNSAVRGHLRDNVDFSDKVCFEIDEAGTVFEYGRFECDSSVAYASVILFGVIRVIEDEAGKRAFCDALMAKYGKPDTTRPKGFYPRLDDITVYAITVERMTGKETRLLDVSEQWPAQDRTRTPRAKPSERP